jgi:hypothetical protein
MDDSVETRSERVKRSRAVGALIVAGSAMFVFGLAVSAAFAAEWRVLHFFQALIYVALVMLARRNSPRGFGIGLFVAGFWNALSLFTTTATRDGIVELARAMSTGKVERPDLLLNLFAFAGHTLIMIGCVIGFLRLRPGRREWSELVIAGLAGFAYLLAIVFAFGPPQAVQLIRHAFGF